MLGNQPVEAPLEVTGVQRSVCLPAVQFRLRFGVDAVARNQRGQDVLALALIQGQVPGPGIEAGKGRVIKAPEPAAAGVTGDVHHAG